MLKPTSSKDIFEKQLIRKIRSDIKTDFSKIDKFYFSSQPQQKEPVKILGEVVLEDYHDKEGTIIAKLMNE